VQDKWDYGINIGINLSMNHAKLIRGIGIVPQGKIDLNQTNVAPKWCLKDKVRANLVQRRASVAKFSRPPQV
jgi:hypothetical protein